MIKVRCKCGGIFERESKEDNFTLTFACPMCKPNKWRLTKFSGIKWSSYPQLKSLLLCLEDRGVV